MIVLGNTANKNQSVSSVTLPYTTTSLDRNVYISGTSGTITVHTAVGNQGQVLNIIHSGTSLTQVYTITSTSGQTIGRLASGAWAFYTQDEYLQIVSDNANWSKNLHLATTDWTSYTTTATGFGTLAAQDLLYKRDGSDQLLLGRITSGTPTSVTAQVSIAGSQTIAASVATIRTVGTWNQGGGAVTAHGGMVLATAAGTTINFGDVNTFGAGSIDSSAAALATNVGQAANRVIYITARIPITGWQP